MKNILKIIVLTLVLSSCKKDKPIPIETTITLTGRIVKNCAGDPLINHPVEIWLTMGGKLIATHKSLDAKTDSNGNFKWTFDKEKGIIIIALRVDGADILTFDPKHRNLGTIIATPTCNVVMKIKVNNPYSVGDTLQLKDFTDYTKGIRIGAPFKDTVLSVAYDYAELRWPLSFEQKNTTYVSTNIYI